MSYTHRTVDSSTHRNVDEELKVVMNFDEEFAKSCVAEWKKRQAEIDEMPEEKPGEVKAVQMLAISGWEKKDILRKLKNKKEHKIKFPCDSYNTTFKLVENQLVAYEPRFPMGRKVTSVEEIEKDAKKSMFSAGKFNSARGFFISKLASFGYSTLDAVNVANGFGFNGESEFIVSLFAMCLANMLNSMKVMMTHSGSKFALVFGADNEQEIADRLKIARTVVTMIDAIKTLNH